jgi:hypothetical protein
MTLILPFQNQNRDIMKKGQVIKENRYTQQAPNQTFNEDKSKDDKKDVSLNANEK